MNRLLGILVINIALLGVLVATDPGARSVSNFQNLGKRLGVYGVPTIGAGVLIIAGGIDLSVGSVIGLSAVSLALLIEQGVPPALAIALVLVMATGIGFLQGLLVAKGKLQPFVVTLCGLFIYRGIAQLITSLNFGNLWSNLHAMAWEKPLLVGSSRDVGIGAHLKDLTFYVDVATGTSFGMPNILLVLLAVGVAAAVLLHFSVYGRYLYAVGYNEQAARYAGISTDRYKIFAYVQCSFLAGLGGVLHMFDIQTAQPSAAGQFYELYAIAGAVLGGCSLRGGQGTVVGMILGTAVLPLLRNLIIFAGVPTVFENTVIGGALLIGTIADELLKRRSAKKV